jgi:hypothetical protein
LAVQPDLRLAVPTLIGVTAGVVGLLAFALYAGEKGAVNWSPVMIMVVAGMLRALFLCCQPELSDDIYRYLWDGIRSLAGHNPYSLAPIEVKPQTETLAQLLESVNHARLVTVYPPAAQVVFMAGSAPGGTVLGFKVLLAVMDLGTCAVILRLLSRLQLPAWRATLYAWHSLPGMGYQVGFGVSSTCRYRID